MSLFRVTPETDDRKDLAAAAIATHILDVAPSKIVLQRAHRYWFETGTVPSDDLLRRWYQEEK